MHHTPLLQELLTQTPPSGAKLGGISCKGYYRSAKPRRSQALGTIVPGGEYRERATMEGRLVRRYCNCRIVGTCEQMDHSDTRIFHSRRVPCGVVAFIGTWFSAASARLPGTYNIKTAFCLPYGFCNVIEQGLLTTALAGPHLPRIWNGTRKRKEKLLQDVCDTCCLYLYPSTESTCWQ